MEECYLFLNNFKNLSLEESYKVLNDTSLLSKFDSLNKEFEKYEISVDIHNLLVLYFIHYNPNTLELHTPILTYYKLSNVNKFCVNSLNSILQNNDNDWLKFEYYWKHYEKMFKEWAKNDILNIKYYMTLNIINNHKDNILGLNREDTMLYVLYIHL
jgi:hypothetical protein